ncbi:MAG: type IV pilin protein [Roseateles sp.]
MTITRQVPSSLRRRSRHNGFTLVELMVAVAVIAVLAAIAIPNYTSYTLRSRRADAMQSLALLQQAQERWRAANPAYATNLTAAWPGGLGQTSVSSGGYYNIAISSSGASAPTGSAYWATATAVSGKSQARDTDCATMTISVNNGAASNRPAACWSK